MLLPYSLPSSLLLGTISLATISLSSAATYNVHIDFNDGGRFATIRGTITTSQLGTFTTETEIENFFSNVDVAFTGFSADESDVFTMISGPTSWDLQLAGTGASASVTASQNQLVMDFLTPIEFSSVRLFVVPNIGGEMQFAQSNNIDTENFVFYDAFRDAIDIGTTDTPYNSPFVFNSIPEPTAGLLGCLGILGLAVRRKR